MADNRITMAAATDIITSRTKYHNNPRWTGTFLTSKLVPIYAKSNIRPGDTIKMNISQVIRGLKPVFPVMDDAFLSVECYFAKHKHLLSRSFMSPAVNDSNRDFKAWIGAQSSLLNMPLPDNDIKLPAMVVTGLSHTAQPYQIQSLADYLLYPPVQTTSTTSTYKVNPFKVLTYYSIWNSYFREPNLQSPVTFSITATNYVQLFGDDAGVPSNGREVVSSLPLAPICRDHGYFGSGLPWPQRNSDAITMPLGDSAPVYAGATDNAKPASVNGLNFRAFTWDDTDWSGANIYGSAGLFAPGARNMVSANRSASEFPDDYTSISPSNLYADLSVATAATVNQVRYAFATQRWFEQLARSGNRYDELVYGMTGVRQRDSYDDRPEYLGGKRIPLTASQVNVTAGNPADAGTTGDVGGFFHMADNDYYFTKSFDDFGTLMIVAYVRVKDTFAQGIQKEDTVFSKFDIFWSQFANIGEVPIKCKEIYVAAQASDDQVFGYQEAWADYRLQHDGVSGYARPGQSFSFLTFANNFNGVPNLKSFLTGSQVPNVDRTLAVQSSAAGFQWYGQFMFDMDFIRQVPMYSIPGYIDHH